jgi:hypothetical protein
MYGTALPSSIKLLEAGARVCKVGSLMFLLLGPKNYQICPQGIKRIGCIALTVVPNNEFRALNIYYKYADAARSLESNQKYSTLIPSLPQMARVRAIPLYANEHNIKPIVHSKVFYKVIPIVLHICPGAL